MFYSQFGLFFKFSNKIAKTCDLVLTPVCLSFSGGALSDEDYLVLSSRFGKGFTLHGDSQPVR